MSSPQIIVQSAVRLPSASPPPPYVPPTDSELKRKRPSSRSRSPPPTRRDRPPSPRNGRLSRPELPPAAKRRVGDVRVENGKEKKEEEKKPFDAKAEYEKLLSMRSGGTYIPPARLRALQAEITDKSSKEYQKMAWEALKKSINGLINKVNVSNIKHIVPELFGENLIRGRGLFCRSIMKAQAASLPFTPIYAAMTAVVNTKLPQVGELLLNRLVVQFRKAFKRNDKAVCISASTFIAHLCNQQVAHEILAIEILMLLLSNPTDDSVEIAVGLTREVGQLLEEVSPRANNAIYEQFRTILHEAGIDKRVQYMIEVLFQVRRDRFKDHPSIREELDLVEEEDQITHRTDLDGEIETMDGLNVFKFDPDYEKHEALYAKTKAEILGEDSDEESGSEESGSDESESEAEDEEKKEVKKLEIIDQTNTNLANLRRTIYLTIMSSIDFEECCHKLMKISLPEGMEQELCSMIIECCSQERTYSKFYGNLGERFAKLNRLWTDEFSASFDKYYTTIHRYETNKLRNIAKFFAHMFASNALGWQNLGLIKITEEDTTASSRIFIKILFQDLAEDIGMKTLVARLTDPMTESELRGIFPTDDAKHLRFSINFFTSIGLGAVTEKMRENLGVLQERQKQEMIERAKKLEEEAANDSDSESSRSYSSDSGSERGRSKKRRARSASYDSRSRSRSDSRSRSRSRSYSTSSSRSRSPPRRRRRSASYSTVSSRSRSRSPSRSVSRSRSRTPPRRSKRASSYSRSPSRTRGRSASCSPKRSISRSLSRSRSRTPIGRRGAPPRDSKPKGGRRSSRSPSRSLSRSPPPRSARKRTRSYSVDSRDSRDGKRGGRGAARRDSRSPTRSRSRTPVGRRGGRRESPPRKRIAVREEVREDGRARVRAGDLF